MSPASPEQTPPPPTTPAIGPGAAPAWPYLLALVGLVACGIAFGLVAMAARRNVPGNLDRLVLDWVVANRADWPGVTRFFRAYTVIGNHGVSAVVIAVLTAAIFALHQGGVGNLGRGEALFFFLVTQSGEFLNNTIKLAFRRDRPPIADRLVAESTFSFPSGHSAFGALIFGMLAALLARSLAGRVSRGFAVGLCLFLAFLLAGSRVWLGVHYATDVVGGLVVGFSWVVAAWLIRDRLGSRSRSRN